MKAIILAAGRGSRMGNMTADKPKCFAELSGHKLIEWQIAALKTAGIKDTFAIGGYRSKLLQAYLPVPYVNEKWIETNSVASLLCAHDVLSQETCVVSYSDIVYHPDHITNLINQQEKARWDICLTYDLKWLELWSARAEDPLLDAETFSENGGIITDIGRKPQCLSEINGQYMGLLLFTPAGWSQVTSFLKTLSPERKAKIDMTSMLSELLNRNVKIGAVPIQGKWCEVDTIEDKEIYEAKIGQNEKWSHDWRDQYIGNI